MSALLNKWVIPVVGLLLAAILITADRSPGQKEQDPAHKHDAKASKDFSVSKPGASGPVGSPTSQGAFMVGHINSSDVGAKQGLAAQEAHQTRQARFGFGNSAKLLGPKDYREKPGEEEPLISTTFGIRNTQTNKWSFYAQAIEKHYMGKYILRTIKKFA